MKPSRKTYLIPFNNLIQGICARKRANHDGRHDGYSDMDWVDAVVFAEYGFGRTQGGAF